MLGRSPKAWLVWVGALALAAALLVSVLLRPSDERPLARGGSPERIVSLTPALTETLFAIGAGSRVIAVSDYCRSPRRAAELPRAGTALTPNYELLARLEPTLIVSEAAVGGERGKLERIAPTERLPWLSLDETVQSVRRLGDLTGHRAAASELAARLQMRLSVEPPRSGPRVLLVLANESETLDPVWFIRRNSIHGAALHAAGARNAVEEVVPGLPRMSLERVIALDPDGIVLLSGAEPGDPRRARLLASWSRLTGLSAIRNGKLRVIDGDAVFSNGPRILEFADQLAPTIAELSR